ncbi:UDP-N-acetylmuramate dehydrogenase [Geomonas sp.]|uniref:UDP-N-acetylmuramate dehydrogenase n=1 Tax=Geomonas sp. TaxID=2651584 RepID=UPI002B487164|nr:UDP-N-acetylmuramate dehydrogenase [Geomonas sp.]HJV36999.1 UDP-N-acetylmuramate dehydrogenase [Geomonas sp.]
MITILENLPLAPFTSLEIGGPARFFATTRSIDELREALLFARGNRLPFAVLGGGSNLLISDRGFDGLVVRVKLEAVERDGNLVRAEAGVDLTSLVHDLAHQGLSGMESLAGIPGLVGGAVRGNAGAYGSCIGELSEQVVALDAESLELVTFNRDACAFRYRFSRFKEQPRLIVISTLLALTPGMPEEIRARVEATLARRAARNLQCERSVGSFFMNPVVHDPALIDCFEADQHVRSRDGRIPAGWLIDRAGLRSTAVGGASVSPLHANYLINSGQATAEDMVHLAQLVKGRVLASLGVELQEEVSRLGFAEKGEAGISAGTDSPVAADVKAGARD